MKENTKKALYESIMQKVSQQVVEMLNENNSINEGFINRYNNAENGTFMALDKLIDNYNSFMFDELRKGLFIKVSNPDLGFAIASMLTAHYKNRTEQVYLKSKKEFMEFGLYELPEYSKRHYAFVVIQEFENVDLSAYPIIANMVDGQIKDKTITVPIVIVSTIVPHNKTFMQRFKYFEMKY